MKKRAFRLGAACVLASVAISAAHAVSNTKTIRLATFDEPFNLSLIHISEPTRPY